MHEDRGKGYFDEQDYRRGTGAAARGLSGVFALMFLGLLASAVSALFTLSSPFMFNLVFGSQAGLVFAFLPLLVVMLVFPRVWHMSPGAAFTVFFVYALLNGVGLSVIFLMYDLGTIALAFFSAAGMFGVMAVYGRVTRADLSGMGSMLFMGLIGIVIASVLNWFFANDTLDMFISYAGIAIFLGLTAYDVQRIKRSMIEHGGRAPAAVMVMGALHLYLDFLNIFLFLLRLLGRRR